MDGRVLRDVEREARLPDAGPGGEDDEVALLQARRQRVQLAEPGPDPAHLAPMGVEVVEPVVRGVEEVAQGAEPDVHPPLAHREQLRLRAVDRGLDVRSVLVPDRRDLARRRDEVPQHRLALDDAGVVDGVDGGGRLVAEHREVGATADGLELVDALEHLGDGDDVHRLASLEELEDRGVDDPVRLAVEVLRPEELGDLDDRVAVDEDGAEDRLLGLDALRR